MKYGTCLPIPPRSLEAANMMTKNNRMQAHQQNMEWGLLGDGISRSFVRDIASEGNYTFKIIGASRSLAPDGKYQQCGAPWWSLVLGYLKGDFWRIVQQHQKKPSSEEGLLVHPHETACLVGLALILNDREGASPLAVISLVVIIELDLPHRFEGPNVSYLRERNTPHEKFILPWAIDQSQC